MSIGSCLRPIVLGLASLCLAAGTAWAGIKSIELDATWSPDSIAVYCEQHQGILWGIDDTDAFGRYGCLTDEHALECDAEGTCVKVYDEDTEEASVATGRRVV